MKNYSNSFQTEEAARKYENFVYAKNSYDSFIWGIQSRKLISIFEKIGKKTNPIIHLDYACGTGRILSLAENLTKESTGIDVSENMISIARKKVKKAKMLVGDVSENDDILAPHYDVITLFRFILNTEPSIRNKIMNSLVSHLRAPHGRLIFDIQGNRHSLRHLTIKLRPKPGERINEMSYKDVRRLVEDCGLDIESWCGFGVLPPVLHRSWLGPLIRVLDNFFAILPLMKWVSYDLQFVCRHGGQVAGQNGEAKGEAPK